MKNHLLYLLIFLFFLFLHCSGTVQESVQPESPDQEQDLLQSEKALLTTTIDYGFIDRWYKTLSETGPQIIQTDKVYKEQYFHILLFFLDYGIDPSGKTSITYDLTIYSPDNGIYFEEKEIPGMDLTVKGQKLIQMANGIFAVCFEPEDPFGTYTIVAAVSDHISGITYSLETQITLVEWESQTYFTEESDWDEWVHHYYESPSPQKAIDGYLYFCTFEDSIKDNSVFYPLLSFFTEIFKNNTYLIQPLIQEYPEQDMLTRICIIFLLHTIENEEADIFLNSLKGDELSVYHEIKDNPLIAVPDDIDHPAYLDFLWARFLANGKYDPVLRLVKELAFKEKKAMIYGAAKWSIAANCRQHNLVYQYCSYIYQYEDISDIVRQELGEILNSVGK